MSISQIQFVFIDPTVPQPEQLLLGLPAYITAIYLNSHTDAIEQITDHLRGKHNIDALHIVTHGSPGKLHFSNAILSVDTLNQYWDPLASWSKSLSDNADILLYGCETGQGQNGQFLVEQLSVVTGCTIAAASESVGHTSHGAQWRLTETTGTVTSPVFASDSVQQSWLNHLSNVTHTFDAGSSNSSNIPTNVYASVVDIDGFTYSITAPDSGTTQIGVFDGGGSTVYSIISSSSDRGLQFNFGSGGTDGATGDFDFRITNSSAFKIASLEAEMGQWGTAPGYLTKLTVTGYLNGNAVTGATDTVDFKTSDTKDSISYTKGANNSGTLTFNSSWENIDEIRFTGGINGGTDRGTLILDDIDFDAAPANAAPTITNGGTHALSATDEDTTTTGVQVSTIIANGGSAIISDGDGDTLGIAVTATTGNGSWQFSTDDSDWTAFGAVTGTNSLLLDESTYVRYVPDGDNGESVEITFRGWDQSGSETASTNGSASYKDTDSNNDGSTPFSSTTASATLTVDNVNDAPTITNSGTYTLTAVDEETASTGVQIATILADSNINHSDVDSGASSGVAITSTTGTGTWQYSADSTNGSDGNWTDFGSVSTTTALLLDSATYIRFTGGSEYAGNATFAFNAWDQTSGTASSNGSAQTANASVTGTTRAFSNESATTSITVNAVDDAPTGSGAATSASFTEDTQGNLDLSGFTVADVDSASVTVTLTATAGTLAATSSGGVTVGGSSTSTLTLTGAPGDINTWLDTTSNVTYTGAANANGTGAATITIAGADGTTSDVVMGSVSLNISAVDDAPTVSSVPDESVVLSVGQNIDLAASSVADVDSTSVTAVISVDSGALTAASAGGTHAGNATVAQTNSQTVTLTGSPAQIDAYLNDIAELSFTSAASTDNVTLTVSVDDGVNAAATDTATISVLDVARPTASDYTDSTNEDTAVTAFSNTELPTTVDGDNGTAHTVEYITIDTSTVSGGVLSLTASATGGTSTVDSITFDTAPGDLSGTVNIAIGDIDHLVFTPTANLSGNGAASFDWTVTDSGGDTSETATWTLDITPVEDAPTLSGVTSPITAVEDTATNLVTGTPVFADVDTTADVQATLTATDGSAVLTASDANGVVVSNSGTNAITLTGTATEINTFLATPSNITYTGSTNNTTTDTVTVSVDDGETGTNATAVTITVNFTAVNDEPVVSATSAGGNSVNGVETDLFNSTTIDVATADSADLVTGVTFTVSGLKDGADEIINFDNTAIALTDSTSGTTTGGNSVGYFVSVTGTTATVTLTHVGIAGAHMGSLLDVMSYENTAVGFSEGDRVITLTEVTDDGGTANGGDDTWSGTNVTATVTVVDGTKPTATSYTDSGSEDAPVNLSAIELPTAQDVGLVDAIEYITIDTSTVTGGTLSLDSAGTAGPATDGTVYHVAQGDLTGTVHINILDIGKLDFTPTENLVGTGAASFDWTVTDEGGHTSPTATYTLDLTNTSDDPTAADTTETVPYNGSYTFTTADFGFSDVDTGDSLDHITITSLPSPGSLTLNNVAVSLNADIDAGDIDSGLLVFTPENGATGSNYASFGFTVSDGTNDSTAQTVTLNVAAAPSSGGGTTTPPTPTPTPTPTPQPEPETETEKVDGVTVETVTTTENGKTVSKVTVEPVTDDREDTDNSSTEADIPLHFDDNDTAVTTVSLPQGVGLTAYDNTTARENNGIADLISMINDVASIREVNAMTTGGRSFLSLLTSDQSDLWANELTLTTNSDAPPAAPITIQGSSETGNGYKEALVIDASNLPQGTVLDLKDVEFAVIVGPASLTGGEGANIVYAGGGSQHIVLGEDDDELHGGDGDDTVGSRGGDDLIFGDAGNDTIFGGAGKDQLHGGLDNDTATFDGNRDEYDVVQVNGVVTVTSKTDSTDVDTLINVEQIQFADQTETIEYETDLSALATLYQNTLGRQADLGGFQWWADSVDNGLTLGGAAVNILRSAEAEQRMGSALDSLSAEDQIEAFYTEILGRASDAEGKAHWVNALNNGASLEQIAEGFVRSVELSGQYLSAEGWDFTV